MRMMHGLGGYSQRNYNGSPPEINMIPPIINEFDLAQYVANDEFGRIPPTNFERPSSSTATRFREDNATVRKYVYTGVAAVSLIAENLLSHPFVVLRRQCQVHNTSKSYHLVPITLVPVIYNLHQHQGLTSLWKGLGSVLLVRGLTLGVEDLISKVTPWPKNFTTQYHQTVSTTYFTQVVYTSVTVVFYLITAVIFSVSLAVITPFYSASLVETVQSDIASEKPGILDVFKEGFMRLLNWNGGPKGRMLPVWVLVLPTVTLGICRYFFSTIVKGSASRLIHINHQYQQEQLGALPRDPANTLLIREIELTASLISIISSDIVFYPFETILHRLHLQGTRTIIDNLDTGKSVIAILTNCQGPIDCYESCLAKEGVFGLYKGFGALILQYAAHIAVVYFTRFLLTELTTRIHGPSKRRSVSNSPPVIPNMATSGNAYLLP